MPLVLAGAAALAGGCGPGPGGEGAGAPGPAEGASHPSVGTVGPDFVAQDPSGGWLPLANLRDRPVALLFFRPGSPSALELARDMSRFRDDPSLGKIVYLGLSRDSLEGVREYRAAHALSLPILRDPGSIARSYGVGDLPTVVLLDAGHVVRFRLDGYLGTAYRARVEATEAALRELPREVRGEGRPMEIAYSENPRAPVFSATDLDGRRIDLASLRGKVVVLNFFDQECPHCDEDLPRLARALAEFRGGAVAAIGVTSRDLGGRLRAFLAEHGIDYPVVLDPAREIFRRYGSTRTPDTFIIDRDGFVRFREQGDRPDREELTRLQVRLALGEGSPGALAASLPEGRYAGDGICRSCHAREFRDWLLTPHSIAWDSLGKGDRWRDPDCVGCHVTGEGADGGFRDPQSTPHMVNVQCEVCHGPGGGHPGGAGIDPAAMSAACADCHSGKFVLNFDLDEAMALVAHRDDPDLDRMFRYSEGQRERLERVNRRRLERFRSGVAHVGAEACRACHQAEYRQWERTPHAAAFARLLRERRGADPACLPCHTTGMGLKGGFGDPEATASMTNVQCEVCHGPGADHVGAPEDAKVETIYGITDQCSFCIIQGVCTACHDQDNDPDFDIETALPRVTHRADRSEGT
ncbi:MAG: redoxin domain-containing protein [Acidobacteriota bacterium]